MAKNIKYILKRIPGVYQMLPLYRSIRNLIKPRSGWMAETACGPGSTIKHTENIRKGILKLLNDFAIKRILDAPCGDYNWFRLINRSSDTHYIGGDIVKDFVYENNKKYANENTRFVTLDITKDILPSADLWICRACLFHFSYLDIYRTLQNLIRSDIKYFLTSLHTECKKNTNIKTGEARTLNLYLPPFEFPKPLLLIDDIDDWVEGHDVTKMGLWEKDTLSISLVTRLFKNLF